MKVLQLLCILLLTVSQVGCSQASSLAASVAAIKWPVSVTPILQSISRGACEVGQTGSGGYGVLSDAFHLQIAAPWPAELQVTLDHTVLQKVDDHAANALRNQVPSLGYWVEGALDTAPAMPIWSLAIGTPAVEFPPASMALEITSHSLKPGEVDQPPLVLRLEPSVTGSSSGWNQADIQWAPLVGETGSFVERRTGTGPFSTVAQLQAGIRNFHDRRLTDGTTYAYRVKSVGCVVNPQFGNLVGLTTTTSGAPKSGTEEIHLHQNLNSQFTYSIQSSGVLPRWDAVITSVKNTAVNSNGLTLAFSSVGHVDDANVARSTQGSGISCPNSSHFNPNDVSTSFLDQGVAGEWTAEAVCVSAALLPPEIMLSVGWKAPH
jgi:hypothetical protein